MLHRLLATARVEDFERASRRYRWTGQAREMPPPIPADSAVTLRFAFPDDEQPLRRLAALDSSNVPAGPVLLAEIAGELRAALSLRDGQVIADPFQRCDWLIVLLRARAVQLSVDDGATGRLESLLGRLRLRVARARP